MALTDAELGKILVDQSYLSVEDLARATEHAKSHDVPLKAALFDLGLLTQELYEGAVAEYFRLPYVNVQTNSPSSELLEMLPEEIARQFNAVVIERTDGAVTVATADPSRPLLEEAIRLNLGQAMAAFPHEEGEAPVPEEPKAKKGLSFSFARKPQAAERQKYQGEIRFAYAAQSAIESLLVHYRKPLATRFQSIIDSQRTVAPEILDEIINDAIELRASDIHFEPQEKIVIVRFRVDGVMHEAGRVPREHYEGVINRIKIESNMRIDEHYAAQDGAIRFERSGQDPMDIRVSIVPLVDGEKVVMRLLSAYVRSITLSDLGFSATHQRVLEEAARKPFGMILTVGPTGAGKSTTLYALLKLRNHPDVNISTIEDPVEYKVPGINHIQVNPKTNLTFASGLRALVRQDPDIVLVGEIRDGETADIAVNAALTGHLLFSTLHANDAATAIPRLLEMGVEPFLLASTLEVIVAQRLVRRLCPHCRYSYTSTAADIAEHYPEIVPYVSGKSDVLLYKAKGCEACGSTGYKGRVGIYELLEITPAIGDLIVRRVSTNEFNLAARSQGMKMLFEDGFDKVLRGITSLEELLRVAAPPESPRNKPSHDKPKR